MMIDSRAGPGSDRAMEVKMNPLIDKVVEQLKTLPYELQLRVYEFTRDLAVSAPHGVPGRQLLRFAGTIPADDVRLMSRAIEENCERIDNNEW
jgi:hypothetical protein